jgi:hypothetical protein
MRIRYIGGFKGGSYKEGLLLFGLSFGGSFEMSHDCPSNIKQ